MIENETNQNQSQPPVYCPNCNNLFVASDQVPIPFRPEQTEPFAQLIPEPMQPMQVTPPATTPPPQSLQQPTNEEPAVESIIEETPPETPMEQVAGAVNVTPETVERAAESVNIPPNTPEQAAESENIQPQSPNQGAGAMNAAAENLDQEAGTATIPVEPAELAQQLEIGQDPPGQPVVSGGATEQQPPGATEVPIGSLLPPPEEPAPFHTPVPPSNGATTLTHRELLEEPPSELVLGPPFMVRPGERVGITPGETAQALVEQHLPEQLPVNESFFENIMRLNQGKLVDVYMNFDSSELTREAFRGILLEGGRDNIVLKNVQTGLSFVLLTVFLNFIVFHGEVNFNPELAFEPGLEVEPPL